MQDRRLDRAPAHLAHEIQPVAIGQAQIDDHQRVVGGARAPAAHPRRAASCRPCGPAPRSSRPSKAAMSRSSSTTRMRACEAASCAPSPGSRLRQPPATPLVAIRSASSRHRHTSSGMPSRADSVRLVAQTQGGYASSQGREYGRRPEENAIPASILIADDDPNILRALSFLMQREGHDVRTAIDGAAGARRDRRDAARSRAARPDDADAATATMSAARCALDRPTTTFASSC